MIRDERPFRVYHHKFQRKGKRWRLPRRNVGEIKRQMKGKCTQKRTLIRRLFDRGEGGGRTAIWLTEEDHRG